MRRKERVIAQLAAVLALAVLAGPAAATAAEAGKPKDGGGERYIFGWPFIGTSDMAPRGGTTEGPEVTVDTTPSAAWRRLREDGVDKKERDRRAILAMAGPYRASFDFLETVGFSAGFEPARPFRSWGTEYIYVVADEPDFISLQHIMVMVFRQEDGSLSEPMVIKHWRQDWRYEDTVMHVYAGDRRWRQVRLDDKAVEGRWTQAVYQVDDSPRYESFGDWVHTDSYSIWESAETWRPLPRREFSVRDDYDVLIGTNRHTVLPDGWVHEEDNRKVVLEAEGDGMVPADILARETGVNRYQRVADYDWSAGERYWQRTAPFWRQVRAAWGEIFRRHESVRVAKRADGRSLVMTMFSLADGTSADDFDADAARVKIDAVLDRYVDDTGMPRGAD
ncbi:DUF6607 family protein [Lentisalinibacter sediminis]|uniref:DUF6607 family protein n=1 Tax=Lentisalinibacter sediminis TaxID=2992237 RepID=UPI0038652A15